MDFYEGLWSAIHAGSWDIARQNGLGLVNLTVTARDTWSEAT